MPNPENEFANWPDEILPMAFRMAVFIENWDLRDGIFRESDRRRLEAMDDAERAQELQFRARFEQIEGVSPL